MAEFGISDYGIFTNGISTAQTLNQQLSVGKSALSSVKSIIGNESIFMGPAATACLETLTSADGKLDSSSTNFSTIVNFLTQTSENYKQGDQSASATLLASTGTPLLYNSPNGSLIYYSQKGYYDQSGNFHRWESSWGKDIASSGCGPTSMAACLANMFHDPSITPSTIANMMSYNDNIGGSYVAKAASHYNLDQTSSIGLKREESNNLLRNGGKMIVAVNNGGHYIAVIGINDSTNPPTYIVDDPFDDNTATKTWRFEDIAAGHTMVFHIAPPGKTVQQCISGGNNTLVQV